MSFFSRIVPLLVRQRTPHENPQTQGNSFRPAQILALFEETALLGHVPADALIGRLHASYGNELAKDRQRLLDLEHALQGHLMRLDARFPAPVPPEPEKPQPLPGRRFQPLNKVWTRPETPWRH